MIKIKRAYEPASPEDGARILVDRLWPRGLSKERAAIDLWLKDIAPSDELRKWYGHDPGKWPEFERRYFKELQAKGNELKEIRARARKGDVTLLYGTKEREFNNAHALRDYLKGRGGSRKG
jgi:uncharacterized protein YeaO (DUF488 family)